MATCCRGSGVGAGRDGAEAAARSGALHASVSWRIAGRSMICADVSHDLAPAMSDDVTRSPAKTHRGGARNAWRRERLFGAILPLDGGVIIMSSFSFRATGPSVHVKGSSP